MPRTFRRCVGLFLAGGAMSVLVSTLPAQAMTSESRTYLSDTNLVRMFWHEAPLAENATLDAKAQFWAAAMAMHHSLVESSLPAGLQGLPWAMLGENVGEAPAGVPNAIAVLANAFVASAPHFYNMVNSRFNAMGVGVARSSDGTLWVTEEFAQLG